MFQIEFFDQILHINFDELKPLLLYHKNEFAKKIDIDLLKKINQTYLYKQALDESEDIIIDKNSLGLDQVDNVADKYKEISIFQQEALDSKQDRLISNVNICTLNGINLLSGVDIEITKKSLNLDKVVNTSDFEKEPSLFVLNLISGKQDILVYNENIKTLQVY